MTWTAAKAICRITSTVSEWVILIGSALDMQVKKLVVA